jgi:hypothetical protein
VQRVAGGSFLTGLAYSPDGQRLAASGDDGSVKVWDAATGREVLTLRGHTGGHVNDLAYSPDGRRLASCGDDATVRVWDAATGQELLTLRGPTRFPAERRFFNVAFSPDGLRLVATDGTVRVWDATPLTPELLVHREAYGVLNTLFTQPLLRDQVRTEVRNNATLSEPVRKQALALIDTWREETDPERYAHAARWAVLHYPHAPRRVYERALAQAHAACRLNPLSKSYRATRGMAFYRVGQYEDALKDLLQGDQGELETPVYLAMTLHRLARPDEARSLLLRAQELLKKHPRVGNVMALAGLSEAEELIEGRPTTPPTGIIIPLPDPPKPRD